MTDPIGTAQERELIEKVALLLAEWVDGGCEAVPQDLAEEIIAPFADALQSRIAEVAALKEGRDFLHQELEVAGERHASLSAEVRRVTERVAELWEAIFKVKDRCWEADDANWQHDILSIVVPLTDAKIDEDRAALSLQRRV